MKIRIYAQDAEPFSAGGGSPLTPTRCEITANLNSDWTLTLEHPLDADGMYKQIQSGAVLRMPAFNGSQLYRIITADRTDSGITATAEPIFMDALHDVFLLDSRPTNLSGQAALDYLMSGTKFSGQSDILNLNTAYYVRKNLIEALNGEDENAFTQRWGGEILFDNYKVIINRSAGRDKGVVVKYGRNLTGITETVDRSSLITRIVPVGYDGIMLSGSAPWVDSPLIDSYPIIYNSVIEYSDVKVKEDPDDPDEDGFATLAEAQAELRRLANLEYSQNNVDKELVSMDVDLILLQNTVEYAEFKNLEDVSLGDTVTCRHAKLGIDVSAKVVSLTWDCITGRVTAVTLGNFKQNYFSSNTNRVDQALGNASSAQNAAQNAQNVASGAQSAANQAQQAAGDAQTAAGNAQTAAGTAQSAADQAQQAAGNAQSAAQGAQNTADSALNAAQGAQNTANQANQNAQNAQTAAGNAQQTANGAQSAAENAQQTADNVSNLVNQVVRPNGTVIADKVQGILDAALAQLHLQNTAAKKQNVRAILFEDLDPDSPTYGAMSIGTQGFQIADERTADGLDWNWRTAATAKGAYADVIGAGTLKGVEILADNGTIGGWKITNTGLTAKRVYNEGSAAEIIYTTTFDSTDSSSGVILKVDDNRSSFPEPHLEISDNGDYKAPSGGVYVFDGSFENGVSIAKKKKETSTQNTNGAIAHWIQFEGNTSEEEIALRHMRLTAGTFIPDDGEYAPAVINPTVNYAWQLGSYGLRFKYGYFYNAYVEKIINEKSIESKGYISATRFTGEIGQFDTVEYYQLKQTSDEKLKKDIKTLNPEQCVTFLNSIRPVSFKFINDESEEIHSGFIAQEIADVQSEIGVDIATEMHNRSSNMLSENEAEESFLGIDITAIIAPLVSVVQSQQTEIEQLKQKLSELEAKIN